MATLHVSVPLTFILSHSTSCKQFSSSSSRCGLLQMGDESHLTSCKSCGVFVFCSLISGLKMSVGSLKLVWLARTLVYNYEVVSWGVEPWPGAVVVPVPPFITKSKTSCWNVSMQIPWPQLSQSASLWRVLSTTGTQDDTSTIAVAPPVWCTAKGTPVPPTLPDMQFCVGFSCRRAAQQQLLPVDLHI